MIPHKFIILTSLLLLPACAHFNSISRNHDFNHGTSNIIDAKQRAIISVTKVVSKKNKDGSKKIIERNIVCSEPSPDALTALAAAGALEGGNGKIGGKLAGALSESAGSIGLRTQTIQLLRDDKYRLCEAYANGVLDKIEYSFLLRQAQKNMLALLAIEQLTGAISAPAITLTAGSNAALKGNIETVEANIDNINTEISNLEQEKVALSAQNPQNPNAIKENNRKIEEQKEKKQAFLDSIRNGTAGNTQLSAVAQSEIEKRTSRSSDNIKDVSGDISLAVENMVNSLNNNDYTTSLCMMEYQRARLYNNGKIDPGTKELCATFIGEALVHNKHIRNMEQAIANKKHDPDYSNAEEDLIKTSQLQSSNLNKLLKLNTTVPPTQTTLLGKNIMNPLEANSAMGEDK